MVYSGNEVRTAKAEISRTSAAKQPAPKPIFRRKKSLSYLLGHDRWNLLLSSIEVFLITLIFRTYSLVYLRHHDLMIQKLLRISSSRLSSFLFHLWRGSQNSFVQSLSFGTFHPRHQVNSRGSPQKSKVHKKSATWLKQEEYIRNGFLRIYSQKSVYLHTFLTATSMQKDLFSDLGASIGFHFT